VPEFLLEVGCEEIPSAWLAGLADQLRERFGAAAERDHLVASGVRAWHTPRRLVLCADLPDRQPDRQEKVWGPSLKVARDAAGKWTGAAQGFARKNGVTPEDLTQAPKDPASPAEAHLLHLRTIPGRPAAEVLSDLLPQVLRALAFPKRMSWDAWLEDGKGAFPFGRPIRWVVAVLGGVVVPFRVYALESGARGAVILESGDRTRGHRFLPRRARERSLPIGSFAELQRTLREAFVLLDPAERAARIQQAMGAAGVRFDDDHGLLAEWRDLVEYPTVVFGSIPTEFRSLPVEVLETVLVHHQKYLPLAPDGGVPSRFAAVTDTDGAASAEIVRGMERVVVARLRDAAFFFQEDLKRPLADRVAALAGVTFHQGLGSYRDKAERMVRLVEHLGAQPGLLDSTETAAACEAARLAKADLTTLMVREFPELQGVMGALYLGAQGEKRQDVVAAVRWHYHPVSMDEGAAPAGALAGASATLFAVVALADKLDTLAGCFGLGLMPSGSSDPYGLRRAAQGAVRVLLDFWRPGVAGPRPSLRGLAAAAIAGHAETLKRPAHEVTRELEAFLLDRVRSVLLGRGFAADEVDAALGAREPDALDDPREALLRVAALGRVRREAGEAFEHLAVAFKRAKNILGKSPAGEVEPARFVEPAETELHRAIEGLSGGADDYATRLRALAGLRGPVDRFFDDVLVMAEDPALRANRLGLLARALLLFYRIADISRLGG
jgi:glycyl-tRNA synthetase beta chain